MIRLILTIIFLFSSSLALAENVILEIVLTDVRNQQIQLKLNENNFDCFIYGRSFGRIEMDEKRVRFFPDEKLPSVSLDHYKNADRRYGPYRAVDSVQWEASRRNQDPPRRLNCNDAKKALAIASDNNGQVSARVHVFHTERYYGEPGGPCAYSQTEKVTIELPAVTVRGFKSTTRTMRPAVECRQ